MHAERFIVCDDVTIEPFDDMALVLLCDALELRQVDARLCDMLPLLDGQRTVIDVAHDLRNNESSVSIDADQIAAALQIMEKHRIVRRITTLSFERKLTMSNTYYLANPDVSFRQEGDDGGILFNQDTDGIEVLNPIAVEIWKRLASPSTAEDVINHLCSICENAPRDEVTKDVDDFLSLMLKKKFIGIVEDQT